MKSYFNGLFLMKNKIQLAEYLENFINKAAYTGFVDFDMKKLTLALRVMNPDITKMDPQVILNYLMLLSSSSTHYKEMDSKSVNFVEECLDLVEKNFSGKNIAKINIEDIRTGNEPSEVEVEYYDKLKTTDRNYAKYLKADDVWLKRYINLNNYLRGSSNKHEIASEYLQDLTSDESSEEEFNDGNKFLSEEAIDKVLAGEIGEEAGFGSEASSASYTEEVPGK